MAERGSLTPISEAEFETIEAAVMETARGRWFLGEFARRNRTADTQVLLDAIGRLEQTVAGERAAQGMDRLRFDLMEMAKAIARTKSEIAAIHSTDQEQSRLTAASESLDGIVRTTEQATSDILEAAEHIQETAWTLREDGVSEQHCDQLDRRATDIYTACSFQDLTAQRTRKIVQTLRYLEGRINAMIDIWGGEEPASADDGKPAAPRAVGSGLSQNDVDIVIVDDDLFSKAAGGGAQDRPPLSGPVENAAEEIVFIDAAPAFAPAKMDTASAEIFVLDEPVASRPRLEAFAEIDSLDAREKLKRFT
jgi:chemotaxis regulatin CheY-phosphate phosphatase CheZ